MKRVLVLLGLCVFTPVIHAADVVLQEVESLGRLNGTALACSQKDNINRIKAVMTSYAPRSRVYGEAFEEHTNQAFLVRSKEQEACGDAPVIALQVESLAVRLQQLVPSRQQ